MSLLSRDEILAADDRPHEDVPVPEWGGTVRVCGLSGTERDAFEASLVDAEGRPRNTRFVNFRARLLARSIVDENGNRIFADKDIRELGAKSGEVITRLFDVAQRLSGMTAKDVEQYTGNSDGGQSDDSISA